VWGGEGGAVGGGGGGGMGVLGERRSGTGELGGAKLVCERCRAGGRQLMTNNGKDGICEARSSRDREENT